jgi:hypothetical protein
VKCRSSPCPPLNRLEANTEQESGTGTQGLEFGVRGRVERSRNGVGANCDASGNDVAAEHIKRVLEPKVSACQERTLDGFEGNLVSFAFFFT